MLEQSKTYPAFIGGNADLVASTKCYIKEGDYSYKNRTGKNIDMGLENIQWAQYRMDLLCI